MYTIYIYYVCIHSFTQHGGRSGATAEPHTKIPQTKIL